MTMHKALVKRNPKRKVPSKLDKNFKIYILAPLTPFFPKWLPIAKSFSDILFVLIKTNIFIKKKFVKIGLKIKTVTILALAPFDPVYL